MTRPGSTSTTWPTTPQHACRPTSTRTCPVATAPTPAPPAPRRYGTDDLAWLLDSAAGYLVESGGEHGQPVYRIFHQALIEHLRPEEKETQRQRELVEALMRAVPPGAAVPDWARAPS